ncbi:hypothetical protein GE061_011973 [Apolygus lucorum]|uniref:Uncharacterized protein n=1 Tax=Apolygus lucorum TaxID=248454 RepID=A0A8S9XT19_APOLU|nr:hypothetical protein GE061_011973 [Apolygus lucorum]
MDSIRLLEMQQEVLIHQVNAQLEDSVRQLKHTAMLQHEISEKQKSAAENLFNVEKSKKLTAQLHAIDEARSDDIALSIGKDTIDRVFVKDLVDRGTSKDIAEPQFDKETSTHPKSLGINPSHDQQKTVFPEKDHQERSRDDWVDPRVSVDQGAYNSKLSIDQFKPDTDEPHTIDRIDSDISHTESIVSEQGKSSRSS